MAGLSEKLRMAESAVRLLRDGLKQPAGYKSAAQQQAAAVRAHVASAQAAVDAIRDFTPYNQHAKSLVADVDRLTSDSERILQELATHGAYRGLLRSQMTAQETAEFIGKHGGEKYLALPW